MAQLEEMPLKPEPETSGTDKEFNIFAADGAAPQEPPAQAAVEVTITDAEEQEELSFINVSSGTGGDDAVQEPGVSPAGAWSRVVAGYHSAKALKTSMTQDLAPWSQFVDRSKFSVPNKSEVFSRVRTNLKVYHSNYCFLLGGLAIWTAVSNLAFVIAMALSVALYYYYKMQTSNGATFIFRGREVPAVQFYLGLAAFTLFNFWLTGGSSTMFWLIISAAIVVFGHASARQVDEQQDEESFAGAQEATFSALSGLTSLRM